jgi:single stranded DNA-binding protein (ssb)
MNLNKVFLIGRLTRDPEIRVMPSGQQVANFGLATDSFYTDKASGQRQQKTEFHNLVLFGRLAEIAGQYLKKGSLAMFEGRIQTRDWQDQSGNKRYRTEIIAEAMQLGPRPAGGDSGGNYPAPAGNYTSAAKNPEPRAADKASSETDIPIIEEDGDIDVKNIPF